MSNENVHLCDSCGYFHRTDQECISETEILTVIIREEGGYWNVYEIDSNILLTQCLSKTSARIWAEVNFCDVREES